MMLLPCNFSHGMVEKKLPRQIYSVLERSLKLFTMLSFLKYVSLMELLQLALILKRHHVLVNQLRIFLLLWGRELAAAQFRLLELTISEYVQKLFDLETEFISKFSLYTVQEDWLLKTKNHLE